MAQRCCRFISKIASSARFTACAPMSVRLSPWWAWLRKLSRIRASVAYGAYLATRGVRVRVVETRLTLFTLRRSMGTVIALINADVRFLF